MSTSYDRIYRTIMRIPRGRVTTYGTVARLAGLAGQPRLVGYALHSLGSSSIGVPWHRVINAQGKLSLEEAGASSGLTQRLRLQQEGVVVNAAGRVDLKRFGWEIDDKRSTKTRAKKSSAKSSARRSSAKKSAPKKKAAKKKAANSRKQLRLT